jgi:AmmeMemoRadiSam system protein B/AmmeMemoRadiSam system protein A
VDLMTLRHQSSTVRTKLARSTSSVALLAAIASLAGCGGCAGDDLAGARQDTGASGGAASSRCPAGTLPAQGSTRPAVLSGSWYPGDAARLRKEVRERLDAATAWSAGRPVALIVPHAGYRFSAATAAYGYRTLQGQSYERVFVLGPSHRAPIRGVALPSDAFFETPLGRLPADRAVIDALGRSPLFQGDARAHGAEHSLEIQLPLLQVALERPFAIVPLLVGELGRAEIRQVADELRAAVGPKDLVVASSDFTHYGPNYDFVPFRDDVARRLTGLANDAWSRIEARDVDGFLAHKDKTGDTICGFLPVSILLGMLPDDAKATRLRFDTSGEITGEWANSVSYLSVAFTGRAWSGKPPSSSAPPGCLPAPAAVGLDGDTKQTARLIAQSTLERWVRERQRFDPEQAKVALGPELRRSLGVFVTLKKNGELRGCIGNTLPEGPLYQAIVGRTIDAASNDGRFSPVTAEELGAIELELSVLTEPKPIAGPSEIVLGRDGVILHKRARSALFLPQVAPEQGWSVEQMLTHLAVKAGLGPDDWRDGATFEAFEALVF